MQKMILGETLWVNDAGEWWHIENKTNGYQPVMDEETLEKMGAVPLTEMVYGIIGAVDGDKVVCSDKMREWMEQVTQAINQIKVAH